jgi:serine/threonine protein kinase
VAVKVIAAESATDPDRLARFEQEARAAAAINHPNILAVFDIGPGSTAHGPYIVSELLEGETLGQRLTRGRLPVRTAIELATQVARALAAAHERGIVHRDLKPDNIFVTRDGTAKVLDFGLAKLREAASGVPGDASTVTGRPATAQGAVLGTVGYMAPEQVRGAEVDHRADLFALGVTLYGMLSGQRAFAAASSVETPNAILTSDPAEFETLGVPVPADVARIVAHCLEKQPADRFQSARDLAFHLAGAGGSSGEVRRTLPLEVTSLSLESRAARVGGCDVRGDRRGGLPGCGRPGTAATRCRGATGALAHQRACLVSWRRSIAGSRYRRMGRSWRSRRATPRDARCCGCGR